MSLLCYNNIVTSHLLVYSLEVIFITVCGGDDFDGNDIASATVTGLVHGTIGTTT